MKPVTQLPTAELVAEFEHLEQVRGACSLGDELAARHNALCVELGRRVLLLEEAKVRHNDEQVHRFAHSAATVITNLWAAHGGREMKEHEATEFGRTLFKFFAELGR